MFNKVDKQLIKKRERMRKVMYKDCETTQQSRMCHDCSYVLSKYRRIFTQDSLCDFRYSIKRFYVYDH